MWRSEVIVNVFFEACSLFEPASPGFQAGSLEPWESAYLPSSEITDTCVTGILMDARDHTHNLCSHDVHVISLHPLKSSHFVKFKLNLGLWY